MDKNQQLNIFCIDILPSLKGILDNFNHLDFFSKSENIVFTNNKFLNEGHDDFIIFHRENDLIDWIWKKNLKKQDRFLISLSINYTFNLNHYNRILVSLIEENLLTDLVNIEIENNSIRFEYLDLYDKFYSFLPSEYSY